MCLHGKEMMEKPQILVLNKMDIPGTEQAAKVFRKSVPDRPVMLISAADCRGIEDLKYHLLELLENLNSGRPEFKIESTRGGPEI